jgi:heat shock protein HtpX
VIRRRPEDALARHHRDATRLHLVALAALYLLLNLAVAGTPGFLLAAGFLVVASTGYRLLPAATVLRMHRARPAPAAVALRLEGLLGPLARRAGLDRPPELWLLPRPEINALCVQGRDGDALALSEGALRECPPRELAAICAHEFAHVANRDQAMMQLASYTHAVTSTLSAVIVLAAVLSLPLSLVTEVEPPPGTALAAALLLPVPSLLVLLSLSRTRELAADLVAAELLGDARPMAEALARVARLEAALARVRPVLRLPPWLSSHPGHRRRIAHLARAQELRGWG